MAVLRSHPWEFAPSLLTLFAQIAPFLFKYEANFLKKGWRLSSRSRGDVCSSSWARLLLRFLFVCRRERKFEWNCTESSVADANSSLGRCQRWESKMHSAPQGALNRRSAVNDTLGTLALRFCPPNLSQTNLDQVAVQHFCLIYLFKSEGRSRCLYSGLHP